MHCKPYICTLLLLLLLAPPSFAGSYTDSAHGDSSNGVSRSNLSQYSTGNCAHCHEQHASIDSSEPTPNSPVGPDSFLLLAGNDITVNSSYIVDDNACFQCHSSTSLQTGGITNYDYSGTFAGFTGASGTGGASPTSIMDAFNKAHSHNLGDIHDYASTNFSWYTEDSNPCTACHNPHLVKRNKAFPNDRTYTVMSMPDDHENLFGDGSGESAADHATSVGANYTPPTDEPTGLQTPDYNQFCLYCHENVVSTSIIRTDYHAATPTTFMAIDWTTEGGDGNQTGIYSPPGDKHGINEATDAAAVDAPFTTASNLPADDALQCVNCHEAHGSENDYMHRRSINGIPLGVVITGETNERGNHCLPCHTEDTGGNKWKDTHHGGGFTNDNPYKASLTRAGYPNKCEYCHGASSSSDPNFPIPCEDCHFHGSYVDEYDKHSAEGQAAGVKYVKPDFAPYRRKTF